MIRQARLVIGVVFVLAMAGCGGEPTSTTEPISGFSITPSASPSAEPEGSSPEGQTTNADCASLATAAEVSEIVGTNVTGPNSAPSGSAPVQGQRASSCTYTGNGALVLFIVGTVQEAGTARLIFEQLKQAQSGEDVSGLGDQAFFAANSHTLVATQGSTFLNITLGVGSLDGKSAERAAAIKLGTQILSRLSSA